MKKNNLINKILISSLAIACVTSLAGCAIEASPYTQEELDRIGEYSALLISGNDPNGSRLVDEELVVPEDEVTEEEEAEDPEDIQEEETEEPTEPEKDSSDIDIVDVSVDNPIDVYEPSLEEYLNFAPGVTMTYKGYEWRDSLTNNSGSYFYDPEEGNYFLILNYTIFNASGTEQDIDFLYGGYGFNLNINGEKTIVAHEIPINEDLPTYIGRLADGSGVNLMITFECDRSYVDSIESMKLTVKTTTDSCSVVLE